MLDVAVPAMELETADGAVVEVVLGLIEVVLGVRSREALEEAGWVLANWERVVVSRARSCCGALRGPAGWELLATGMWEGVSKFLSSVIGVGPADEGKAPGRS